MRAGHALGHTLTGFLGAHSIQLFKRRGRQHCRQQCPQCTLVELVHLTASLASSSTMSRDLWLMHQVVQLLLNNIQAVVLADYTNILSATQDLCLPHQLQLHFEAHAMLGGRMMLAVVMTQDIM